jgi:hypothetical protein
MMRSRRALLRTRLQVVEVPEAIVGPLQREKIEQQRLIALRLVAGQGFVNQSFGLADWERPYFCSVLFFSSCSAAELMQ